MELFFPFCSLAALVDLHYAWWHLRLDGIAIGVLSTYLRPIGVDGWGLNESMIFECLNGNEEFCS